MLLHIIRFLHGYVLIRVSGFSPERFLNLCSSRGILVWDIASCGAGYEMKMSIRGFRQIRPLVRKTKTKIMVREKHGLPFFIFRNRKRKVFFAGMAFCAAALWFLSLFIWDIRVDGGVSYTQDLIVGYLREQGIVHGMRKSQVDCGEIQALIRNDYPRVTWASASIQGTRLLIEIKEDTVAGEMPEAGEEEPADLVAPASGVISEMIVRKGTPVKRQGDTVEKGEALISGRIDLVNDSKEVYAYEYCRADGDVDIVWEMPYACTVSRAYEEKVYTGRERNGFFIRWLSKSLSLNPQTEGGLPWDTLTQEVQWKLLDNFYLPIYTGTILHREYQLRESAYSDQELAALLGSRMEEDFEDLEKKGVQIIENNVKIQLGSSSGTASGTLTVRQRASEYVPAEILPDPAGEQPLEGTGKEQQTE